MNKIKCLALDVYCKKLGAKMLNCLHLFLHKQHFKSNFVNIGHLLYWAKKIPTRHNSATWTLFEALLHAIDGSYVSFFYFHKGITARPSHLDYALSVFHLLAVKCILGNKAEGTEAGKVKCKRFKHFYYNSLCPNLCTFSTYLTGQQLPCRANSIEFL